MFWLEGHEFLTGRQYVICGDASNQAEGMHSGMAMAEGWWSSSPFCWPEVHLPLLHWHREWCAFGMLKQCCLIDIEMIFSFAPGCSCFSVSRWCIYIYRWILKRSAEGVDVCIFLLNSLVNCARTNSKWPSESSVATAPTWRQHLMLSRDRTKIFRNGKWSPWQGEITL